MEHLDIDWEKLHQNQISVREDLHALAQPSPVLLAMKAEGIRSVINVPLMVRDDLIGSLNLAASSPGFFTAERREIAQEVASQLAVAIQQARLYEAERDQRLLAEALRDTAAALNSTLDLGEVLERILDAAGRVIPHDGANIMLVDPVDESVRVVRSCECYAKNGLEGPQVEVRHPFDARPHLQQMIVTQQPLTIPDVHVYPGWNNDPQVAWLCSYAGTPICIEGKCIGLINFNSRQTGRFTSEDAERLQAFANQAATAIRNAELYQELESYSSFLEQAVEERTAELKVQKEQAEAVLQSASDAMILTDPQGLILTINRAFTSHTGYEADEIVGQHIGLVTAELADSPTLKSLINAVRTQQSWRMETHIRRKDGTQFDADLGMAPLKEEGGGVRGWVTSIRDISAFKEVERLKDEFLSTAAHELRTPLTSIRGFSEILMTRDLDETRRKSFLRTINEQSTELGQIIDDLLDISRLQAGRTLEIKHEPVDMGSLVAEMTQPFITTSPRHHFEFDSLMGSPAVLGDQFRLGQVVRNLLSNAVKYSPAGGAITVRGRIEQGSLEVTVQDEGIGMTPQQQAHLFEKFYRADPGSSAIGGTGLGLTICKLIVEEHGGRMWAESEAGVGSKFIFTVPLLEGNTATEEQLP